MKNKKRKKICLISSSGGHFEQLLMLRKLSDEYNVFIVTEKTKYNKKDKKINYYVSQVNRKEKLFIFKMIRIFFKSLYIFVKERPDVVISTGVLASIPMIFFGIYDVEAIVTHEIQHIATYSRYLSQLNAGKRDQDKTEYECAVQTGYGLCVFHEKQNRMDKCDHIVDDDEENGFEIVVGRKEVTIPANFLNKEKVDTYGVRRVERAGWWEYGGYGDDEILSRIAECLGFDNADPKKDWAYPGELAGDIPPEASPSYRGKRMLSATPKSSSKSSL